MEPNVLVISNECFSKSSSNGRTLGNFFIGWPKDKLRQFYISESYPDFEYCNSYFRITDAQAFAAFKTGKCSGGLVEKKQHLNNMNSSTPQKRKRNALTMLLRNLVWESGRWKKCGFEQWVKEYNPDIILLQAGDCAFMFRLAVRLAKKNKSKLIIYNSEGYYFKNFDYFRSKGIAKLLYPFFQRNLKNALEDAYNYASYIFYSCDELKMAYDAIFSVPSEAIYTASDIELYDDATKPFTNGFVASYCGNLGLGRHQALIEVAEALQKISTTYYVDVYGRIPNLKVQMDFDACKGIRYHGFVSYGEVRRIIGESDLLLHVESFEKFYQEDLKYAFSTKIADLLSSGKCFLLYAPEQLACSRYLKMNDAAFVVSDKKQLKDVLEKLVINPEIRNKYRKNAIDLSERNHRNGKNISRFQQILKNQNINL